jgi:hypothetical protein
MLFFSDPDVQLLQLQTAEAKLPRIHSIHFVKNKPYWSKLGNAHMAQSPHVRRSMFSYLKTRKSSEEVHTVHKIWALLLLQLAYEYF